MFDNNRDASISYDRDNYNKKNKNFWIGLFFGEFVLFGILLLISFGDLIGKFNIGDIDIKKFTSIMEKNGYKVNKIPGYSNAYMKEYYIALNNGKKIDFVVSNNNDASYLVFNQFKNQINKGSDVSYVSFISLNNYNRYAVTTNGLSYVIVRDDNIVLYGSFKSVNRKELKKLFASLGYDDFSFDISTYLLFLLLVGLLLFSLWKIFVKAKYKGWYALIPFYNLYILTKISYGKGLYFLLLFIPFVNIVFVFLLLYKLALKFGHGKAFAICSIFFSFVTLQIMAFDDSKYVM